MSMLSTLFDRLKLHTTAQRAAAAPGRIMHPIRDWYVLLVLFVILVIALLGLGGYLYLSVVRGDLYAGSGDVKSRIDTIDRSVLRETTLFFEGQAQEFEELRKNPPEVLNPF